MQTKPIRKRPKLSVSLHPEVIAWLKSEADAKHIDVSAVVTLLVNSAMVHEATANMQHTVVNGHGNRVKATVRKG